MFDDPRFRLRALFRSDAVENQLDEELRFHFDREVDKLLNSGHPREEALRRARLAFGGVEQIKEDCRDARGVRLVDNMRQDFRFGLRQLRKSPGFAMVAILTLALGIGANTAIFSMVNALLLRPYDFRDLDQLVRVWEYRGVDAGIDERVLAPADAAQFADSIQVFSAFATYRCRDFNLTAYDVAQPARGCNVSANFFDVLGVNPAFGRSFSPEDDQPGAGQVIILSHGFWQRRLGAALSVLGSAIQINGRQYTVIGVMPPRFDYPVPMEFWIPLALTPAEKADRSDLSLEALARLRPGEPLSQAQATLEGLARRLEQEYPVTNANRAVSVLQLRRELYSFTLPLFLLLQAAALLVLLLAVANLVNVYFARMISRQKELAMRLALGAGRGRLAQLLICESLLLSVIAALVAVGASFWSGRALRTSISPDWTMWVPGWDAIRVDTSVLVFTVLIAVVAGITFGLCSVYHAGKMQLNQTLKEGGPGNMSRTTGRVRSTLVVAQVMFALTLLVSAGLMIQGFTRLADIYKGFEPSGVLRAEIALPDKKYSTDSQVANFQKKLLRQVAALPGVSVDALNSNTPASNVDNPSTLLTVEGSAVQKASETPSADVEITSPNYFQALHIALLTGRSFTDADAASAPPVAVISERMAKRFWPPLQARRFRFRQALAHRHRHRARCTPKLVESAGSPGHLPVIFAKSRAQHEAFVARQFESAELHRSTARNRAQTRSRSRRERTVHAGKGSGGLDCHRPHHGDSHGHLRGLRAGAFRHWRLWRTRRKRGAAQARVRHSPRPRSSARGHPAASRLAFLEAHQHRTHHCSSVIAPHQPCRVSLRLRPRYDESRRPAAFRGHPHGRRRRRCLSASLACHARRSHCHLAPRIVGFASSCAVRRATMN
jgi:putative ABC transport system permease protein